MLRVYKMPSGRTYRFEEGQQPAAAILAEVADGGRETAESRASKAPAKRAAAKKTTKKAE